MKLAPRLEDNFSDLSSYLTREFLICALTKKTKKKTKKNSPNRPIWRCNVGLRSWGMTSADVPHSGWVMWKQEGWPHLFHKHFTRVPSLCTAFTFHAVFAAGVKDLACESQSRRSDSEERHVDALPLTWWVNQDTLLSRKRLRSKGWKQQQLRKRFPPPPIMSRELHNFSENRFKIHTLQQHTCRYIDRVKL